MKHKPKDQGKFDLKAEVIRRFGTITAFAKHIGQSRATVYSAIAGRRNGSTAKRIREVLAA